MTSCLEMVAFTLASHAERDKFVAAAPSVTAWAAKQPGFQYRTLVDRGDHGWIDMIWWSSEEEAKSAADKIGQEMMSSPFMQMIDPTSVKIEHHPVAHMGLAA